MLRTCSVATTARDILRAGPERHRDGGGARHPASSRSACRSAAFPEKLRAIHGGLAALLAEHRPETVAVEDLFHARNARSALKLGHVRGVVLLAAAEAGLPVAEYAPAAVKRAVVGYGRAEKRQVQQMVSLLLGLDPPPARLDVTDALAVAVCHAHSMRPETGGRPPSGPREAPRSWRRYRPPGAVG